MAQITINAPQGQLSERRGRGQLNTAGKTEKVVTAARNTLQAEKQDIDGILNVGRAKAQGFQAIGSAVTNVVVAVKDRQDALTEADETFKANESIQAADLEFKKIRIEEQKAAKAANNDRSYGTITDNVLTRQADYLSKNTPEFKTSSVQKKYEAAIESNRKKNEFDLKYDGTGEAYTTNRIKAGIEVTVAAQTEYATSGDASPEEIETINNFITELYTNPEAATIFGVEGAGIAQKAIAEITYENIQQANNSQDLGKIAVQEEIIANSDLPENDKRILENQRSRAEEDVKKKIKETTQDNIDAVMLEGDISKMELLLVGLEDENASFPQFDNGDRLANAKRILTTVNATTKARKKSIVQDEAAAKVNQGLRTVTDTKGYDDSMERKRDKMLASGRDPQEVAKVIMGDFQKAKRVSKFFMQENSDGLTLGDTNSALLLETLDLNIPQAYTTMDQKQRDYLAYRSTKMDVVSALERVNAEVPAQEMERRKELMGKAPFTTASDDAMNSFVKENGASAVNSFTASQYKNLLRANFARLGDAAAAISATNLDMRGIVGPNLYRNDELISYSPESYVRDSPQAVLNVNEEFNDVIETLRQDNPKLRGAEIWPVIVKKTANTSRPVWRFMMTSSTGATTTIPGDTDSGFFEHSIGGDRLPVTVRQFMTNSQKEQAVKDEQSAELINTGAQALFKVSDFIVGAPKAVIDTAANLAQEGVSTVGTAVDNFQNDVVPGAFESAKQDVFRAADLIVKEPFKAISDGVKFLTRKVSENLPDVIEGVLSFFFKDAAASDVVDMNLVKQAVNDKVDGMVSREFTAEDAEVVKADISANLDRRLEEVINPAVPIRVRELQLGESFTETLIVDEGNREFAYDDKTGLRVLPRDFNTVAGNLTIGIGHMLSRSELDSGFLTIGGREVRWVDGLSESDRRELSVQDKREAVKTVKARFGNLKMPQPIFDLVVELTFNAGFNRSATNTTAAIVNGDWLRFIEIYRIWDKETVTIDGVKKKVFNQGLSNRRNRNADKAMREMGFAT